MKNSNQLSNGEKKMLQEIVTYFPTKGPLLIKIVREKYYIENGKLVGTYRSYYRNGMLNTEKVFDENGERIAIRRYRPDGTRISKLGLEEAPLVDVTLTTEELKEVIEKYEETKKKAIKILHSRGVKISFRTTNKSLLKQFKQFEENRFSF